MASDSNPIREDATVSAISPLASPDKISSQESIPTPSLQLIKREIDCPSFSQLLETVMAANSAGCSELQPISAEPIAAQPISAYPGVGSDGFEGKFAMSHQEVLASVTAKAAQVQAQTQFHADSNSSTQCDSSIPNSSDIVQTELPLPLKKYACVGHCKNSSIATEPAKDIAATPNSDGFSWRKYGQKRVRDTESSRSYYRCTYADCSAKKKIQHSDISGSVIGVVYRGDHNHDPPQKIKLRSLRRQASFPEIVLQKDLSIIPLPEKLDSDATACEREHEVAVLQMPETTRRKAEERDGEMTYSRQSSGNQQLTSVPEEKGGSTDSGELHMENAIEHDNSPRHKRRINEKATSHRSQKVLKDPKIVVHAAGDMGFLSDGYRWRKYGQKMVKGNSHPRSYYRCTSSGCPVRKHIERATGNSTAVIVTYEGKHDHDMPVPKPRQSPSHTTFVIATAGSVKDAPRQETDTTPIDGQSTQCSGDMKGKPTRESTPELGTEKMLESARTLLSMGIELKSC